MDICVVDPPKVPLRGVVAVGFVYDRAYLEIAERRLEIFRRFPILKEVGFSIRKSDYSGTVLVERFGKSIRA